MRPGVPQNRTVVGRAELLSGGHVVSQIARLVRTGELRRVTRGWYRPGPVPARDQDHVDRTVAMVRRAPTLVASHESALLIRQLPVVYADLAKVKLTRNAVTGARRAADRVVYASPLDRSEMTTVAGVRVTTIARTLVDIGCASPDPRTVVAAADAALHRRLLTPAALGAALSAAGHRTGVARARVLLGFADGRSESPGESILRWLLVRPGAPHPDLQVEVRSGRGAFLGRVDFLYLACGVVVEFDGQVKYQALLRSGDDVTQVVLREKAREDRLREAGLIVLRVVWSDFADPAALLRRVDEALAQGRKAMRAGLVTARFTVTPPVRLG